MSGPNFFHLPVQMYYDRGIYFLPRLSICGYGILLHKVMTFLFWLAISGENP